MAGLGNVSYSLTPYGTTVDFIPIVLGNGNIRLEVRPVVSEIDPSVGVTINGTTIPGLKDRSVDTGVELQAGQTLAIAGLVQSRVDAERRGLPWLSEMPLIGVIFRSVQEKYNEIETLILVTPELVEAMNPSEVPPCGPGMRTTSPTDWELYARGYLEVPKCCPSTDAFNPRPVEAAAPRPAPATGPAEPLPPPPPADPIGGGPGNRPADPVNPRNPASSAPSLLRPGEMPRLLGPFGYDAGQ
jgi:pilus assembly protein CpaC